MNTTTNERKKLLALLEEFDDAMLVTHGEHGMHARPMRIASTHDDGLLTFVTSSESPKVDELLEDRRVLVTCQGSRKQLSIRGEAELSRKPERIRAIWKPSWRFFFPQGPEDPNLLLIDVIAERAEYWDASGATFVKIALGALGSLVKGERPAIPEPVIHGSVEM